jgi:glucose/mannose-6-phosphate isomerase
MSQLLDDLNHIQSIDAGNQLGSIRLLGKQFAHGWEDVHQLAIPAGFKNVNKIVFCGMGGSSLGGYVAKYLYGLELSMPFEVINGYHIPAYVDNQTLVVAQAYSGTTEEILSCYQEAFQKGAQIYSISTGKDLERMAAQNSTLHYLISPTYNPCNQPRMGIGYSIVGVLALLHRLELIHIPPEELQDCAQVTDDIAQRFSPESPTSDNSAKQMAEKFLGRFPLYIAGEFLQAAMHAMRNQLNENAKTYAAEHPVSEMNHHLLEAFRFPETLKDADIYVFLDSDLYSDKIVQRNDICKQVIADAGHMVTSIQAQGTFKLSQILSCIQQGAYIGLYLAVLEGVDPSPIPNVERLKTLLAK